MATPTFGRLDIQSELGKGSQGVVYLADDPALKRRVAIKVLTSVDENVASGDVGNELREGEISGKLKHPNIVTVYDAGDCELGPYLVFEYVEGRTLASILADKGPYSLTEAVPLIRTILDAMTHAHRSMIAHLDLSPRNILIGADGAPRIMDFGLSQYVHKIKTNKQYAVGTLRYMSPEHFFGQELGPHTDVFALGSTFLEMLTGERAMPGTTFEGIRQRIIDVNPEFGNLSELVGGPEFQRFVSGALVKNVKERYANGADMLAAFERFVREADLEAAATEDISSHSTIEYLLRRMRRKKEFPTISRTLTDINKLTSAGSDTTAEQLANVILRDFALTSKLLKLVNSSFYGLRGGKITNVSQAVVLLGHEQVRMTANSLTFFSHLRGEDGRLRDAMAKSFLSGLVARHLAKREKLPEAEEAFIGGMFQSLGENLVLYYFGDEYDEMLDVMQEHAVSKAEAARQVLGVGLPDIGAAVADTWQLPKSLIAIIRGVGDGPVGEPESSDEAIRNLCVFANELSALTARNGSGLDQLLQRFEQSLSIDEDNCVRLMAASLEKLEQFAPLFELSVENSGFCQSVSAWVSERQSTEASQLAEPA